MGTAHAAARAHSHLANWSCNGAYNSNPVSKVRVRVRAGETEDHLHPALPFPPHPLSLRQPVVTGTSVLGLRYKDGIMIAADNLGKVPQAGGPTAVCGRAAGLVADLPCLMVSLSSSCFLSRLLSSLFSFVRSAVQVQRRGTFAAGGRHYCPGRFWRHF